MPLRSECARDPDMTLTPSPRRLFLIILLAVLVGRGALAATDAPVVNDITQLNPIHVREIITPTSVEEVAAAVKSHDGPISIGGGRFSMGGQTATDGALQLDMRQMDKVVSFSQEAKEITVQAGITWRKIQDYIDPYSLSLRIMQTYANFTVGGSLSVNVHGRYIGQGPLVRSVKAIRLVLADGSVVRASPDENRDLFYGAIGGYGSLGVIVEATLALADDVRVERQSSVMPLSRYASFFKEHVRNNSAVIFHNADIYPNAFDTVRVTSYVKTEKPVTVKERLIPKDANYDLDRNVFAVISEWPGGKWMRQHIVDPWVFRGERIEWRNYEASYDVRELEPASRKKATYVLQEYFVPVARLDEFVPTMSGILNRHHVNTINVSIRHALPDPGTLLAWARTEVFAFVLYYKQGTSDSDRKAVHEWTRELIDAAISFGGAYYLPYQIVATKAQFHAAYPRAGELFALKQRVDPTNKFRNRLIDAYYERKAPEAPGSGSEGSGWSAKPTTESSNIEAELRSVKGYQRDEAQTYLTLPEWILVFSPAEYARWLSAHEPAGFPYFGAIGQFWGYYHDAYALTKQKYPFNFGYHLMVFVIGTSFTVENALKGLYENTIGRVTEWTSHGEPTPEDRFGARVAQEYVDFIRVDPWYEFSFFRRFQELWRETQFSGPHLLRKWERKLALSLEYLAKAQYAMLITLGTKAIYGDADSEMLVWATNVSSEALAHEPKIKVLRQFADSSELLSLPRYEEFRDAVERLSAEGVIFREIAGNREILMTLTVPSAWSYDLPAGRVVISRPILTEPGNRRIGITVPVSELQSVVSALGARHFVIEHVFDY